MELITQLTTPITMAAAAAHVQSLDTGLCADAVAWNGELLACATYQLDEKVDKRRGGVLLYRLHKNEGEKQ